MHSQSDIPNRAPYPTDGKLYPGGKAQDVPKLHVWGAGGDSPYTFTSMRQGLIERLLSSTTIDRRSWQTLNVEGSAPHRTFELRNVSLFYTIPEDIFALQDDVKPDLPWAEAHFEERVSAQPLNPPPSFVQWPHHNGDANLHVTDQVFSHTYPERFWPKFANMGNTRPNGRQVYVPHNGVRYEYGDLGNVISQLIHNPMTRQAVLPVWFPEDTGAIDRRVPCTLSYHFMADEDYRLSMWYSMRACDIIRHFHNDVYMAARLLQWVCREYNRLGLEGPEGTFMTPGEVNMTISSLHMFKADAHKMLYSR